MCETCNCKNINDCDIITVQVMDNGKIKTKELTPDQYALYVEIFNDDIIDIVEFDVWAESIKNL